MEDVFGGGAEGLAFEPKDVAVGAFEDFLVFVEEDGVVVALFFGLFVGQIGVEVGGGFDAWEAALAVECLAFDAVGLEFFVFGEFDGGDDDVFGDGDDFDALEVVGGFLDEGLEVLFDCFEWWEFDLEGFSGGGEAFEVEFGLEDLFVVVGAEGFENALAVEEGGGEDTDFCLVLRREFAVDRY